MVICFGCGYSRVDSDCLSMRNLQENDGCVIQHNFISLISVSLVSASSLCTVVLILLLLYFERIQLSKHEVTFIVKQPETQCVCLHG